jgi:hypothetical protein
MVVIMNSTVFWAVLLCSPEGNIAQQYRPEDQVFVVCYDPCTGF